MHSPIGIFDSGVGGLTVLKALMTRLPGCEFIYLGDTARLPYGTKSPSTIQRYLEQNLLFLKRYNIKALVVACHSASSVIADSTKIFGLPIYNVIVPSVHEAVVSTARKKIGLIATRSTVQIGAYHRLIHKLEPSVEVLQQACPLLVPLVEEGWDEDPLTNLVIYRYLTPILERGIDTLILGCTHYPVLFKPINNICGPSVNIIDPAIVLADQLQKDWGIGPKDSTKEPAKASLLTTDQSPQFYQIAQRILHPFVIENFSAVDIPA